MKPHTRGFYFFQVKNYYSILGVSPTASQAEIKRAYRKLALAYHPDKNPNVNTDLIRQVNEAYNVLGDPSKRAAYDYRLQNIVTEWFGQTPPHHDPRYRRRRPGTYRPAGPIESDVHYLMRVYLPYVRWICWVGALVTTLFFIDYVLPETVKTDAIDATFYRETHSPHAYIASHTASGKIISHYPLPSVRLKIGDVVLIGETPIFGTPIWIEHATQSVRARALAFLYGPFLFFPLTIFFCSFLGIVFRKNIEFCFNLSVVSGILLVIFWFLL